MDSDSYSIFTIIKFSNNALNHVLTFSIFNIVINLLHTIIRSWIFHTI